MDFKSNKSFFDSLLRNKNMTLVKRTLKENLDEQYFGAKIEFLDFIEYEVLREKQILLSSQLSNVKQLSILSAIGIDQKARYDTIQKWINEMRDSLYTRKAKPQSNTDILDCLMFDIKFLLKKADEQIKQNDYKYYIISSNRIIIDYLKFDSYLRELQSVNNYKESILKKILLDYYKFTMTDPKLQVIQDYSNKKDIFHHIDFKDFGFINLNYNYETLIINDLQISNVNLNSESNRDYFISNNEYEVRELNYFAHRSQVIVNKLCIYFNINSIHELEIFISNLENKKIETTQVQPVENKKVVSKKEFKDFFLDGVTNKQIEKIKKEFKDYKGKKMAYLIFILESDLKVISYSPKGVNDSRKHFVEALVDKKIDMQGINKNFEAYQSILNTNNYRSDIDFKNIKDKLNLLLGKKVA